MPDMRETLGTHIYPIRIKIDLIVFENIVETIP